MVGTNPLAPGDAVDSAGVRATDAAAAVDGAISPFGGPKGYALGLMIEVLVATLTRTALGDDVRGTLDPTDPPTKGRRLHRDGPEGARARPSLGARRAPAPPGSQPCRRRPGLAGDLDVRPANHRRRSREALTCLRPSADHAS
ncbi:Ldh family oxidoreductase [Planotetraspora mira]|uniref:Ldh family oxidoreductase n=1 Tax=Planotetraspora mira TaxID=58121 RepID=UPI003570F771